MSLQTVHLSEVLAKQYRFKLKAYIDVFSSLVGIQLLAIIFSTLGSTSSTFVGFGNSGSFHIKQYSSDLVIMFTFMWMFVTAVTTTAKQTRYQDFSFVGTRLSSSISSILFLVTAAAPAAIFAMLSGYLIRSIVFISLKALIAGVIFFTAATVLLRGREVRI